MEITLFDFEQLTINSTNWNKYQNDWKSQEGRFEHIDFNASPEIDYSYIRAYWVESYSAVIFAKAFLDSLNHQYEIYYDTADDTYMITTNYGEVL